MGTLVFLVTVLALVGTLVALPIALARRRFGAARLLGAGMLGWLAMYAALLLAFAWLTPATVLAPGRERCFDEMCFSVGQASLVSGASGSAVAVTLRLRNASVRTAQKPDSPWAYLLDEHGRTYQPSSAGQLPIWDQRLQPGETQDRTLNFLVPASVDAPVLVVTEGGFPAPLIIGDENSPFHRKTELRLFP